MSSDLKLRLQDDIKTAMRGGDKATLGTLRLIAAAIKQYEVDQQTQTDDQTITAILVKMAKQRGESIKQFAAAQRDDLVAKEQAELDIINHYLPQALSTEEIAALIEQAIHSTGASSMQDMGKVMSVLKPQVQGRADMGQISADIKAKLSQ